MSDTTPDYALIFESAPLLILVLSPDLKAVAATDLYLATTLTKREEIMGRLVYDIFPDNPDDPNPTGVANLKASFNRVLQNKVPDAMGHLKYDIPREDGTFESRYWSTMNTPVLDKKGNILHIINQVVDITDYIVLKEKGAEYEQLTNELKEKTQNMESEIYQRAQQLQAANQKLSSSNEELLATQEELQSMNEEMQATQEELNAQQEELQDINSRLTLNNLKLEKTSMALSLKAEELERSNGFKSDFLSNMSHELRTPLNSMLILSKLLSNNIGKNLTEKQVEQANIIYKAGNDLLMLINDILDLSKIEAGKIEMVMQKTPVAEIAESIEGLFTSIATQKDISFNVKVDTDVPAFMHTDKFRLEQILKNLLSNAFKFTEKGGTVGFHISKASAGTKYSHGVLLQKDVEVICFAISDTGIGIPEEKQSDIFDAFKQVDGSTSRKYGGTGLGLSISRQLTGLLGGEVQLHSAEGEGSTFYVYLPVMYVIPGAEISADEEMIEPDVQRFKAIKYNSIPMVPLDNMKRLLKGKTILITDDDERTVESLKMIFETYGPTLITAGTGIEALKILEANPNIDLVLMDIMMPGMDGYEAIKKIRSKNIFRTLPIIVLTARSIRSDLDEGLLAGVSDYMQKPLDIKQLLATIEIWLTPKAEISYK